MSITDIFNTNPELAESIVYKVTGAELKDFAFYCFEEGKKVNPPPQPEDELLTTEQFAGKLKISKVCLWHWDKKGITDPVRIGNAKRYRRSDLEKIIKSNK